MVFHNLNISKKSIEEVREVTNEFSRIAATKYRSIDIKTNTFPMIMSKLLEDMEIYCIYSSNKIHGN